MEEIDILKKVLKIDKALIYILPGFIGFLFFYILPFLFSIKYAFTDKVINGNFVWFDNFIDLIKNKSYQNGLKNTLLFISFCVPLNLFLSLMFSIIFNKLKKIKTLLVLIMLIPLVIPSSSVVFFWRSMFSANGYINNLLSQFDIDKVSWLDSEVARFVIILIFVWKNLGYNIVLFIAGLSNIPIEYYEAAKVDGATKFQLFTKITLLYLTPTFILVTIMSIVNSFKVFKEIYLVIENNHPHESVYMLQHFMNNMFENLNYPRLTAATCFLMLIIFVIVQVLFHIRKKVDLWNQNL